VPGACRERCPVGLGLWPSNRLSAAVTAAGWRLALPGLVGHGKELWTGTKMAFLLA
jgi:hypothetical protein